MKRCLSIKPDEEDEIRCIREFGHKGNHKAEPKKIQLVTVIECNKCHKMIRASRPHECITKEKDC